MEITQLEQKEEKQSLDPTINEMIEVGLHFGHKTSKTHPKMKQYIGGVKNTVHIFDLEKTKEKMIETLEALSTLVKENKTVLFVGTKVQIKNLVKETAMACGFPYASERWVAGTITNFETIFKRVSELLDLEKKRISGELEKYTKKEQGKFEQHMAELEVKYGGLRTLTKLPDAVFIFDVDENDLVIREAKRKKIKVFALCDTNVDPTDVNYVIPANDDAISAVQYVLTQVKEAVLKAKTQIVQPAQINV